MESFSPRLGSAGTHTHTHTNICPWAGPSYPPSRGRRDPVPMEVGKPSPAETGGRGAERRSRPSGLALGSRTQRAEIHAVSLTPRAWRPARPGELRGAEVPTEAAPGARALPAEGTQQSGASGSKS
ncbi:PREDICTED: LOW QUALITY PROTEIN: putative uncharacterized protein FLJ45983 [Galeopterus variegatus]|uniref:Uncharacterized protein n=1 Tax=Galeopterus variegatus TaxID=482537 RepID=A0ABM0QMG0_GALVR|nr:PREDICTED: LOW QUALITY PROTEIN: putative uncharacterized protein FLJ45983 [Galeopterus variegatus]